MTLQQLEYIVALNRHRHFVRAAEECGVAQPTLSAMIRKLEEELGATLFDRNRHPVEPTPVGRRIIRRAEAALHEAHSIAETVRAEVGILSGDLRIGVIPTVAPYLIPRFIPAFGAGYAQVALSIAEMRTAVVVAQLRDSLLDMAIVSTPLGDSELLEIPLYYERFAAYFAKEEPDKDRPLDAAHMPTEHLWVLQEGHCARNQIFNFCGSSHAYNHVYEAGSIDTLIRIVDQNGGYTVIPELHLPFLTDEQRSNVRAIDSPPAVREISILIRKDYIKERMINAVADTVKTIVPARMIDERLKKFSIRL